MSKKMKIWLIIAASLVLVGGIIFGVMMTILKWDFKQLSTTKYETNNYKIDENYENISIVSGSADIEFILCESSESSVICHELENVNHSVTVQNDTLVIEVIDKRKWYEYIGINFGTPKITVYVPQSENSGLSIRSSTGHVKIPKDFKFENIDISQTTGDVKNYASASGIIRIKTSTGDIHVENVFAGMLDFSVSTGRVTVSNVSCEGDVTIDVSTGNTNITDTQCQNFISYGSTGGISMKNVIATSKFSIERSTGDVKVDGCDAAEIYIETDTGKVTGSFLTDKVFITQSDTGKIDVPKTVTGGRCEIKTDTGDIRISIVH